MMISPIHTRKTLQGLLVLASFFWAPLTHAALSVIPDAELDSVRGQGLFWSDKITGSELAGANAYSTPFTFYRVGIDGELALNANMSKLQLGCGGVNDVINAVAGCDMDIDYAQLMGRNGTDPGNPLSAFVMQRPYLEFAVKGDGTANREIVGINIGAQSVDGAIAAGRRYTTNGNVNQENTLGWTEPTTWNTPPVRTAGSNCNPGVSTGAGVLGCHSGINSVSGFIGAEMSLSMHIHVCILFCSGLTEINAWGCIGRTQLSADGCGLTKGEGLFTDFAGTRMQSIGLRDAQLTLNDGGLFTSILGNGYASLNSDLRTVHKLTFSGGGFNISFQREPVAYPRFSKMTPTAEFAALNPSYLTLGAGAGEEKFLDGCATTAWDTNRCVSAYNVPANTGWWLNAPSVKLMDIVNPNVEMGTISLAAALALLGAPGLVLNQPEFNMTPFKNCYGTARFC